MEWNPSDGLGRAPGGQCQTWRRAVDRETKALGKKKSRKQNNLKRKLSNSQMQICKRKLLRPVKQNCQYSSRNSQIMLNERDRKAVADVLFSEKKTNKIFLFLTNKNIVSRFVWFAIRRRVSAYILIYIWVPDTEICHGSVDYRYHLKKLISMDRIS